MDNANFKVKRRYQRSLFSSKVGVIKEDIFEISEGQEIGEGGMLIKVSTPLSVGEVIDLHFWVPGHDQVTVSGRVVYIRPSDPNSKDEKLVGIAFSEIDEEFQKMIRTFVAVKRDNGEAA